MWTWILLGHAWDHESHVTRSPHQIKEGSIFGCQSDSSRLYLDLFFSVSLARLSSECGLVTVPWLAHIHNKWWQLHWTRQSQVLLRTFPSGGWVLGHYTLPRGVINSEWSGRKCGDWRTVSHTSIAKAKAYIQLRLGGKTLEEMQSEIALLESKLERERQSNSP